MTIADGLVAKTRLGAIVLKVRQLFSVDCPSAFSAKKSSHALKKVACIAVSFPPKQRQVTFRTVPFYP